MDRPRTLHVSDDLTLPEDLVTQTLALLAIRGAGKSNSGAVIAEELYAGEEPFAVIDPKGDWWGLRSSADGKKAGLPIPIFGGEHGDAPLTASSGRLIAEIIVARNLTCILDVSGFESKAAQTRFLIDFGRCIFELHRKDPQPRHIILEECDEYLPQQVMRDQTTCVSVWTKLVKQGRSFGLGVTLISQRAAAVNKNALTQTETMIAMRATSPQDRKAIRDWTDYHTSSREVVDSLPSLADGEAWIISPNWLARLGQPAIQRMRFRRRRTFDSGATPLLRKKRQAPATLADIDLGAITAEMEQIAEEAAANDPAALKRKIATLERRLRANMHVEATEEVVALRRQVNGLAAEVQELRSRPPEQVSVLLPGDVAAFEQIIAGGRELWDRIALDLGKVTQSPRALPAPQARTLTAVPAAQAEPSLAGAGPVTAPAITAPGELKLSKPAKAILTVLARQTQGLDRQEAGILTGYTASTGHFGNAISELRGTGLISGGARLQITVGGIAAVSSDWEPVPEGDTLIEMWMGKVGLPERKILRELLGYFPGMLTRAELGERTGYVPSTGHFGNSLSHLKSVGLITGSSSGFAVSETLANEATAIAG